MTESSEELAYVAMEGSPLPHSHAVLITTSRGWHVELEDIPSGSCPLTRPQCEIAFDSWEGDHYSGTVTASYGKEGYLLLTGAGKLRHSSDHADANRPARRPSP